MAVKITRKWGREPYGNGRQKGEEAEAVKPIILSQEMAYLRAVFNELERLGKWEENPWPRCGR